VDERLQEITKRKTGQKFNDIWDGRDNNDKKKTKKKE
jgi:hypothetical protein